MSFDQQITLLIVGAVIGFFSSLGTTVVISLLNQWLSNRNKRREKEERLFHLVGQITALRGKRETFPEEAETALEAVNTVLNSPSDVNLGMALGAVEATIRMLEKGSDDLE